jgi:hypothetical protein
LAAKIKVECEGNDVDGVEELTRLSASPAKHDLAGTSNR